MGPVTPEVGDLVFYVYPEGVQRPAIVYERYNRHGDLTYDVFVFNDTPETQQGVEFDNSSLEEPLSNTIRWE